MDLHFASNFLASSVFSLHGSDAAKDVPIMEQTIAETSKRFFIVLYPPIISK
jgi:hypothetical protein